MRRAALLLLLLAACLAAPAPGAQPRPDGPLVRIPQLGPELRPTLDGRLADECWRRAALLADFTLAARAELPRNQTQAYLLCSEQTLYVAVICHEWVLDPAQQVLHKFRASVKERDGAVFDDDCVELFISPASGAQYSHLAFNALGTKYDGRLLDKTWNGAWEVAAAVENGRWTAEVAIPLAEVGVESREGARLRFNVCREQKARGENSSWAPVKGGFHEPASFALGVLGPGVVRIQLANLTRLFGSAAPRAARFVLTNPGAALEALDLRLDLLTPAGKPLAFSCKQVVRAHSRRTLDLPFKAEAPGAWHVRFSLADQATQDVLFRSPAYRLLNQTSVRAVLTGMPEQGVALWLNGEPVRETEFSLASGVNVVALRCVRDGDAAPGVKGAIRILPGAGALGEDIPVDHRWRVGAPDVDGWRTPGFDDRQWPFATQAKDGAVWGDDAQSREIVLRRVVVTRWSEFRPIDVRQGLHIARGAAQHAPLGIASPMPYAMAGLAVTFRTPPGLRLVGVFDQGPKQIHGPIGRLKRSSAGPAAGANPSWITSEFRFADTQPLKPEKQPPLFGLAFALARNCPADALEVHYRMAGWGESRNVSEVWRRLNIVCLPPLPDKRCEQIKMLLSHTWTSHHNRTEAEALADTWRQAGFTSYMESTSKYHRPGAVKGFPWLEAVLAKGFEVIVEGPHPRFFESILRKHPEARLTNFEGPHPNPHFPVAPTFVIEEGREDFRREIAEFMRQTGAHGFFWDLEYPPLKLCDASPRALARFAAHAGLDRIPDKQEVRQRHREQWIDFMCRLWADVGKVMREGVKQANPHAGLWVYSAYQAPAFKARYSIDWRYFRGVVDVAAMGYERQPIAETLQALPDTPVLGGVLCYGRTPPGTYKTLKTKILRRITDGARGIVFYNWETLDGRAYHKIGQAVAILADFEDLFLRADSRSGCRVEGQFRPDDVVLLAGEKHDLLLIFNESDRPRQGVVRLPDAYAAATVEQHPDRRPAGAAPKLEVTVPAHDVEVLVVTPGVSP